MTVLAEFFQSLLLGGHLLTGHCKKFRYLEGSAAWLYDCPHFPLHFFEAENYFECIAIHYQNFVFDVDPTTRQFPDYATPISRENISQNVIGLEAEDDVQYVLTLVFS